MALYIDHYYIVCGHEPFHKTHCEVYIAKISRILLSLVVVYGHFRNGRAMAGQHRVRAYTSKFTEYSRT